jgi:acetolactate synthase-1/3 small subunit
MSATPIPARSRSGARTLPAPEPPRDGARLHTISLFVNNKPGVLVRVALVFARRGFNIESLVVSPTARGDFSRMTITCSGDPGTLEQIIRALAKLIDVVHAIDHTGDSSYETEIALVKLAAKLDARTEILQVAEHFKSKVVDYGTESLILRVSGSSEKIDSFIDLLRPFGIIELVRSGKILMARGEATT